MEVDFLMKDVAECENTFLGRQLSVLMVIKNPQP